jgi:two-component system sensor histidine kinase ChvG
LHLILNNLSEATRLEASLTQAESGHFSLKKVISGSMQGYQITYPDQRFNVHIEDKAMYCDGVPEYIAQLMDKLINNAIEFHQPASAINVSLSQYQKHAILKVSNIGPLLPQDMNSQIFESMVSIRPQGINGKPHLGLGLYIARLVTDFHHGSIKATNMIDNGIEGVEMCLSLPLSDEK